jgi:biotin carboxylase
LKKPLAVIGANDFQNRLILKAKELGYETHVFAWAAGDTGEKTADFFYPISITEKERILGECRKIKPAGVVSIASDLAVDTVSFLADRLHLPGNSPSVTKACTNKYAMRLRLRACGLATPGFVLSDGVFPADAAPLRYPLIVKPTDRSGSRGVTKAETPAELPDAVRRCTACSFEKKAIIEEFIEGEEFSAESISFEGRHTLLAVTKKFTTGAPHFIETGHMQPAQIAPELRMEIEREVRRALDALGVRCGASHAEFMLDRQGRVHFIEIGARMGGDCIGSDLVPISTGYDFIRMVIDAACGRAPSFEKSGETKAALIRFIFTEKDLARLDRIRAVRPQVLHRISMDGAPGSREVSDSSTRFGYYILACDTPAEGMELLGMEGETPHAS